MIYKQKSNIIATYSKVVIQKGEPYIDKSNSDSIVKSSKELTQINYIQNPDDDDDESTK